MADAAHVGIATIHRIEKVDGRVQMIRSTEEAIRRALEVAGIVFIPANGGGEGVRLKESRA